MQRLAHTRFWTQDCHGKNSIQQERLFTSKLNLKISERNY